MAAVFAEAVRGRPFVQGVGQPPQPVFITPVPKITPTRRATVDKPGLPRSVVEGQPWPVRYRQVPITIRGRAVSVDAPAAIDPQDLFRLLVPAHRDGLLADEAELRQLVPADLPQVLRLDDWHHTALRVQPPSAERERQRQLHEMLARHSPPDNRVPFEVRPSDIETYRQIGEVLGTADPTRYRPTLPGTTHWSNWPMSGAL